MQLRGIQFESVFSIARPVHGATFVTRTTTLTPRIDKRRSVTKFGAGVVVSSGDFAGHGLAALLSNKALQKITDPFCISFVAVGDTREVRMQEYRDTAQLFVGVKSKFAAPFAIEINSASAENLRSEEEFAAEVPEALGILAAIGVPLIVKVGVGIAPVTAAEILADKNCDALAVSNPIAWSELPENVRKVFFRQVKSPLARSGGGAVTGKYVLPLVIEWVRQLKRLSRGKPVIGGGGILRPKDLDELIESGVGAVSLESVFTLRPWNVRRIINRAKKLLVSK